MWNYKPIAVVTVLYVIVNIYNYPRLIVLVTNNFIGFILFRVGYRDLGVRFGNKLSLYVRKIFAG